MGQEGVPGDSQMWFCTQGAQGSLPSPLPLGFSSAPLGHPFKGGQSPARRAAQTLGQVGQDRAWDRHWDDGTSPICAGTSLGTAVAGGEGVTQSPSTAKAGLGLCWPHQEKPKARGVFVGAGLTLQVFPQH